MEKSEKKPKKVTVDASLTIYGKTLILYLI